MDWNCQFIIYRIADDAKVSEVFHCQDIKKAKYWLNYIALPGDVLCKTPLHPKHSKKSKQPEYWSHKTHKDGAKSSEREWLELAKTMNFNLLFPEEQLANPEVEKV